MVMMIILYNGLRRWWWWWLSIIYVGLAGPIFLSTFLSRCAEWKALVERKFNTWLIINCHLSYSDQFSYRSPTQFLAEFSLNFTQIFANTWICADICAFFCENKCAKLNWAPYSQFLDLYPDTMDDEPRNPYVGDIPEVDLHCIYDR